MVAYHRGKSCNTNDVLRTVQKALLKRKVHTQTQQLVIRTDNGPQFISKAFHAFCEQMRVEHERIPNHSPNKNAYIESFHSILERECYLRNCFE
ncbi:DDE-type integrase/transposase/recombinase, partial [Paenibacillus thermotolerans]|uniref:DDE-type integrase/transposase/recombinase n=1 Tax=Paenibacillus thermotolerans TaxID=3027807 RepID=UPI003CC67BE6